MYLRYISCGFLTDCLKEEEVSNMEAKRGSLFRIPTLTIGDPLKHRKNEMCHPRIIVLIWLGRRTCTSIVDRYPRKLTRVKCAVINFPKSDLGRLDFTFRLQDLAFCANK